MDDASLAPMKSRSPGRLSASDEMRVLGGLVVQPFIASALAFVAFPLLLLDRHGQTLAGGYPADPVDAARSIAFSAGIVAVVVTLAGVWPVAVWLMKRRRLTLRAALLFGVGFGNLPYVMLAVLAGGTYGVNGLVRGMVFSSLLGLSGAAVFWAIALRSGRSARG